MLLAASLAAPACGYRVAGRGLRLPPTVKVIAIPAFVNQTSWMRLEQKLTAAVMQEFIHRARYKIVGDEKEADAVLRATITEAGSVPVVFDPETGRATAAVVMVRVNVTLRERGSRGVLFANPDYLFREQYEITGNLDTFFEERGPALDRLARDFAATLVTAVLENF